MLDTRVYSLLKVVQTGSYTQAARELNLTQPAISQHIHSLEKELGVTLFRRTGNTIHLTREGEKAVRTAQTMLSEYRMLKNELSGEMTTMTSLQIGITHTVESNQITSVLAKYANENSGLTVKLISGARDMLKKKLLNYELDFIIVDETVKESGLKSTRLDTDSLVLVTSPDHELAKKKVVTVNDIQNEKLILRLPNSGTANLFKASLQSQNISMDDFNVILEIENVATIKDLVRHGYGVSVLAKSACQEEVSKGKLAALPIRNMSMNREISIVYGEHFPYKQVIEDLVRGYYEQLK